VGKSAVFLRRY